MPEISRFFGIIVRMFYDDHEPPHFHASYAGRHVIVSIRELAVLRGGLQPRALGLVMEWAAQHQADLLDDWQRARARTPLLPVPPLE